MLIDASAITAIFATEAGFERLVSALDTAEAPAMIPLGMWESAVALARIFNRELSTAADDLKAWIDANGISILPVDAETARLAIDAHARYGKGRHPAKLNFGDCFAYAAARQHGVPLLFKGDDFERTDLRAVLGTGPS